MKLKNENAKTKKIKKKKTNKKNTRHFELHGDKGDGKGTLVKREKILGVPSYADPVRNLTVGTTYYTIHYGLNSMGSYASQMNTEEMWQVSEYVMQLKQDLTK